MLFGVERNPEFEKRFGTKKSLKVKDAKEVKERRKTLMEMQKYFSIYQKTRHTFLSKSCRYIYHIGMIDYLQDYNYEKLMENKLKLLINKSGA